MNELLSYKNELLSEFTFIDNVIPCNTLFITSDNSLYISIDIHTIYKTQLSNLIIY
jgi:hypothetical protein